MSVPRTPTAGESAADEVEDVVVRVGGTFWRVRARDAGFLQASGAADLLAGPGRRAPTPGGGRSEILRLHFGSRHAIGKRALHGGLLGRLLGGIYLGTGRLDRVVRSARRLRTAGVRTPDVLAAGWRPIAGPFRALALVTEEIPRGASLQECLLQPGSGAAERRRCLEAAGACVQAMHATGFRHADLNLSNLVVEPVGGGARVHVVDLERGWFVLGSGSPSARANLARLLRSWEKWIAPRVEGGLRDLAAFLRGYSGSAMERRRLVEALLRQRSGRRLRSIALDRRGRIGPRPPS